ncbi:MAG: hypothetical protein CSA55_02870 [Ilumatobacter coccineus]|uniref:PepSY domain-containing protein n=1 Tax=Ilumatobacter coccineus TaxID=467094 RepID=A0A2G6KAN9_9ACTN|nr:MAG: hypothetical protein CSA55_02870 [Ilumatobacter coccineus]
MKIRILILASAVVLGACGSADTPGSDSQEVGGSQSDSIRLGGNVASTGLVTDGTSPHVDLEAANDPTAIIFPSVITELKLPMDVEEFTTFATEHGYDVRITQLDGEDQVVTADYSPQRINVIVENDQVTELDSMG